MKRKQKTQLFVILSILIALSVILSYFDNIISSSIFAAVQIAIPKFKLGIANIVILVIIYFYPIKYSIVAVIEKSILVALLFTGLTGFIIGFSGTMLSFLTMNLLRKIFKEDKYIIFISAVGGLTHSLGQIIAVFIMYDLNKVSAFLIYAPFVLAISIVTGILVGIIAKKAISIIKNQNLIQNIY